MLQLRRICDTGSRLPWAISGFERPAKASIYKAQHWERPVLGTADGSCLCVHLASLLSELPTGLHAAAAAQQAGRLLCTSGQVSCNNVCKGKQAPVAAQWPLAAVTVVRRRCILFKSLEGRGELQHPTIEAPFNVEGPGEDVIWKKNTGRHQPPPQAHVTSQTR